MKTILKFASVAVFGVMAMAVTVSVKPIRVGLVSEAKAGLTECLSRCQQKRQACTSIPNLTVARADACDQEQKECKKDCEANFK